MLFLCGCGARWYAFTCYDGSRWWYEDAHGGICPNCGRRGLALVPEEKGRDPSREPVPQGQRCLECREILPKRSFRPHRMRCKDCENEASWRWHTARPKDDCEGTCDVQAVVA